MRLAEMVLMSLSARILSMMAEYDAATSGGRARDIDEYTTSEVSKGELTGHGG